jgi:hypothetical protein
VPDFAERVIALDPGQRTGFAVAEMALDYFHLVESGVKPQREMALWLAKQQGIASMTDPQRWDGPLVPRFNVVTWESWRPRRKNGSMNWIEGDRLLPAQHVGQIRLIAWMSGAKMVEQEPADKRTFLANLPAGLREFDDESSEQHDQDARWHLWGYFFREWFSATVEPNATLY